MTGARSQGHPHRHLDRLNVLEASLAAQIRAVERASGQMTGQREASETALKPGRPLPQLPPGAKWLYTPRRALVEDPRLVAQGFARFLFWRRFLSSRRPTELGLRQALAQLRGLVIWHGALAAQALGRSLPLLHGHDAPATAPDWTMRPSGPVAKPQRITQRAVQRGQRGVQRAVGPADESGEPIPPEELRQLTAWWARYGDAAAALNALAAQEALDALPIDALTANSRQWGALAGGSDAALINLQKLRALLPGDQLDATVGDALTFESLLSDAREYGFSDLQIAQIVNQAWSGQASLWAAQDVFANAGIPEGGVGIAGVFDLHDAMFLNFLRQQSGYLIRGIDESTRSTVADLLWLGAGGSERFSPLAPDAVASLLQGWSSFVGNDLSGMSRYRARMIAVTEIARGESFGQFVAMWQLGVLYKAWMTTAGACLICVGNEEGGAIPLTESFPSGHQAPPAHPWGRCAIAPAVADAFDPNAWTPRSLDALYPALMSVDFETWPDVEFPLDFPDESAATYGLAATAEVMRAGEHANSVGPVGALVGDAGLPAAMHAHLSPATLNDLALRFAEVTIIAAHAWLADTHHRLPTTPEALSSLATHLRATEDGPRRADERHQLARADARYDHALRTGFDQAIAAWRADHQRH